MSTLLEWTQLLGLFTRKLRWRDDSLFILFLWTASFEILPIFVWWFIVQFILFLWPTSFEILPIVVWWFLVHFISLNRTFWKFINFCVGGCVVYIFIFSFVWMKYSQLVLCSYCWLTFLTLFFKAFFNFIFLYLRRFNEVI